MIVDVARPNRDIALCHPLVVSAWPLLQAALLAEGIGTLLNEGYRYDARQAWLYGQGRTPGQLAAKGLDPALARAGDVVTNAWSAKTSAHGYVLPQCTEQWPDGVPASLALDVVPTGPDGRAWTKDDPWDLFVSLTQAGGKLARYGLIHFHAPGKQVWDKPHLQRVEWDDATRTFRG